jgi:hypothetical protein
MRAFVSVATVLALACASYVFARDVGMHTRQSIEVAAGASDVPGVNPPPERNTKPRVPGAPGAGAPDTVPKTPAEKPDPEKGGAVPGKAPDAVAPEGTDAGTGHIQETTPPTSGDRGRPPEDNNTTGTPKDPLQKDSRPGTSAPPESIR